MFVLFVLVGLIAGLTRAYLSHHTNALGNTLGESDWVHDSESLVVSALFGILGGLVSGFIVQGDSFLTGFAVFVCAWAICDLLDSVVFFVMHPPWDIKEKIMQKKRAKCIK
ncbi:MAG: hypothetical protein Q7K43_02345 [Candidatus Woesearchaeota archaeon]|nr:hypothetical protein [Candidatus Woesearchaeota archaeon]